MEKIDNRRKQQLNINPFFKDSHDKYYQLGVLATDGNVGKTEPRIRLEVKDCDIDLVQKLASFCETNMPLKFKVNNNNCHSVRLDINSGKLKKYLATYNIIPNKTQSFTIPLENIPNEYIQDFVRGMMDGDGSIIFLTTKQYNPYGISFVSANYDCVKQMKQLQGLPEKHAISEDKGNYLIAKYGKECIPILDNIYKDSNINNRLNRKYSRYETLKLSN